MHSGQRSDRESENELEKKIVRYHPEALDELIEAARFYESKRSGLGERFITNVENAVGFIQLNPLLFREDELGRRKYQVKKFPYLLIYKVRNNHIFILAAAHASRKPGYWESRDK